MDHRGQADGNGLGVRTLPLALAALMALGLSAPAFAQAPAAPLPPGYVPFGAPPPVGAAPGLRVQAFAPSATKTYKVSFKAGDDVMGGMMRFAAAYPMAQAQLSGVGGVSAAVLAWYDPQVRAFKRIEVNEKCEISGVTGTITTDAKGRPNVHLHLVLTRRDGSSVSGHLISATIDPILEVFVTDLGPGKDVAVP
jgi:predicted DNA-binding protein with PD1-like motif